MSASLPRPRRRAFTLLEVLIASSLASIVLLAALGIFSFIRSADSRLSRAFDDANELALLHETIRRAAQTLVASPPPPNTGGDEIAPSTPEQAQAEAERKRNNEEAQRRFLGDRYKPATGMTPRLLLEPVIPGRSGPEDPRRLEVVLLEQPAPGPSPTSPSIRGSFEVVPDVQGLALVWRPLDPPGEDAVLARALREVRWSGLAREQVDNRYALKSGAWRDLFNAAIPKEFPKALRLEIVTMRGTRVDWLFEPAITIGPEP